MKNDSPPVRNYIFLKGRGFSLYEMTVLSHRKFLCVNQCLYLKVQLNCSFFWPLMLRLTC